MKASGTHRSVQSVSASARREITRGNLTRTLV
jgi:hypothetical protein